MPTRTKGRPTLKTIAELSGFAVPTVSRALKDAPDIGAETKAKVRRIAREIGYVPDRAGVRLKTGKTNVVSLVLSTDHDIMNHTSRLIASLAGALRDTPYHMIVTPYFPEEDPMNPVRYIVETRSADAVIMNQTEPRDPRVAYLMKRGFPFATHGRTDWCDRHPYFDFDNDRYARQGVAELVRRGRKHILLIAPPPNQFYGKLMIRGASDEARRRGVRFTLVEGTASDHGTRAVDSAVRSYLKKLPDIDGILCGSPTAGMGAVAALEAAGGVLGREIDVVAKEAVPFLTLFRPGIIAVHEDVATAGEFLARAVIQAINRPDLPPLQALDFPAGTL